MIGQNALYWYTKECTFTGEACLVAQTSPLSLTAEFGAKKLNGNGRSSYTWLILKRLGQSCWKSEKKTNFLLSAIFWVRQSIQIWPEIFLPLMYFISTFVKPTKQSLKLHKRLDTWSYFKVECVTRRKICHTDNWTAVRWCDLKNNVSCNFTYQTQNSKFFIDFWLIHSLLLSSVFSSLQNQHNIQSHNSSLPC